MTRPARGEVWWCELPDVGRRPAVVLSQDDAIIRLRTAMVAPGTTTVRGLRTEVVLEPGDDPVPRITAINLDSVTTISTAHLTERMGRLGAERLMDVCQRLALATGRVR